MLVAVAVSSMNVKRSGSMKRCQARQRRRFVATSGRSCSAALNDFFKPKAEPAQHAVNGREPGRHIKAALQLGLDLDKRDVVIGLNHADQRVCMGLKQQRSASARWRRLQTAGRLDPLHELDRRRRAYRVTKRRLSDRTPILDGFNKPFSQIQRQRCRHRPHSTVSTDIVESQRSIPRNRKMLWHPVPNAKQRTAYYTLSGRKTPPVHLLIVSFLVDFEFTVLVRDQGETSGLSWSIKAHRSERAPGRRCLGG